MSLYQDLSRITVTGNREDVTRMLNAAIKNVGTGTDSLINSEDDIETINLKIKEKEGDYGLRVALLDLFDDVCLQDEKLQEKINKLQGEKEKKEEPDHEEDEDYFEEEETSFARMFDLLKVNESQGSYTVNMEIYECEGGYYGGWEYFYDIARLYHCRIVVDDELFRNLKSFGLDQTLIWEPEGDEAKKTIIQPRNLDSATAINDAFAELMRLDPQRYIGYKTRAYEILIENFELQLNEAKAELEINLAIAENGITPPSEFKYFLYCEQDGLESVKDQHRICVYRGDAEDDLATIYKLRAKRLQDKNKDLAELYNQLLENLHTDLVAEKERMRKNRINQFVERFVEAEAAGVDEMEKWYQTMVNVYHYTDESCDAMEVALNQLIEKSKNENSAFASLYQRFIAQLPSDLEQKRKEDEEMESSDGMPF